MSKPETPCPICGKRDHIGPNAPKAGAPPAPHAWPCPHKGEDYHSDDHCRFCNCKEPEPCSLHPREQTAPPASKPECLPGCREVCDCDGGMSPRCTNTVWRCDPACPNWTPEKPASPAPVSEPPIEARIEIDLRDRHIDALKADREQLRGLVEEYIGTVNALKAQNAALKEQVDDKRSQLLLMAGDLNKSDAQNATLTAERDEARATKDMHKERQEQAWAEVERLRDLLDTLNPPEQCPATCTCGYGCPHGDGCLALCDCPEWEPPNGPYDEARAIRSAREAGKGR